MAVLSRLCGLQLRRTKWLSSTAKLCDYKRFLSICHVGIQYLMFVCIILCLHACVDMR